MKRLFWFVCFLGICYAGQVSAEILRNGLGNNGLQEMTKCYIDGSGRQVCPGSGGTLPPNIQYKSCTANCSNCNTLTGVCSACETGYELKSGSCTKKTSGCIAQDSSGNCTACSSGYRLYSAAKKCIPCVQYSSASACKSAADNATGCVYKDGCYEATCPAGYVSGAWWSDTWRPACHACVINNCSECDPGGYYACNKCFSGYYYYYSTTSFDKNRCRSCPTNGTCSDGINLVCKSGYYKKDDKNLGYRCASCPANATCANNEVTCKAGYYKTGSLTDGYSCTKCSISNCAACSSATTCTSCANGYKLSGGKCVAPTNTVSSCPAYTTKSSDGCCCIPNG